MNAEELAEAAKTEYESVQKIMDRPDFDRNPWSLDVEEEESMMSNSETMKVLYEHYHNCVNYWMNKGQDEREAYLSALNDIRGAEYNPFIPFAKEETRLDPVAAQSFKQARLMDLFGKQWKEHENLIR